MSGRIFPHTVMKRRRDERQQPKQGYAFSTFKGVFTPSVPTLFGVKKGRNAMILENAIEMRSMQWPV
jgi:hypothetical protein